jgi:hypothetical protein
MRILSLSLVLAAALAPLARAEDSTTEKYELRYQFVPGEVVRWLAIHQAAHTTKLKGHEQKSRSTSESTKCWRVEEVDPSGRIKFSYYIENVDMWRQSGDRAEERYNSKTTEKPPAGYEVMASTIGKTVTAATIDPHGKVLKRDDKFPKFNLSEGDLLTPLPDKPIAIGEEWFAPSEIRIPINQGFKLVKIRRAYKLQKVSAGVATISVDTQVLTPVNDPKIEAQLIQMVTKGIIKFDLDAGRLLSRRIDWNETVLGFEGPDSSMIYLARFTEELITDGEPRTAAEDDEGTTR